jgi:hypothetical protein
MTISGSHAAMSHTKSHSPRSATASISRSVVRRIESSWSRTRRGVNPVLTSLRRWRWAGSSMSIIIGMGPESGRMPPAFEKRDGEVETWRTRS